MNKRKPVLSRKEEERVKLIKTLKKVSIALIVFAALSPLTSIGYMYLYSKSLGLSMLITNAVVFVLIIIAAVVILKTNNGCSPKPKGHKILIAASCLIGAAWELVRFLFGVIVVVLSEDANSVTSQSISGESGTNSLNSGVSESKINFATVYKVIAVYLTDILMIVAGLILILQMASKYKRLYWE